MTLRPTNAGFPMVGHFGEAIAMRGQIFFVGNDEPLAADDTSHGSTPDRPFNTLDYAIGRCTAGQGDIVYVMENHAETLIADSGVDADVAGIRIIGLGKGGNRPTFTFSTDAAADFKIAAANIEVANLVFVCDIASQAMMIEVSGDDPDIHDCEFREGSATGLNFITVGVADGDSDRCRIRRNRFYAPTAGNYDSAISVAFDHNGIIIEDNWIWGDFDEAGIDVPVGGNANLNLVIRNNVIGNLLSGQHAIQVNGTGSTGAILDNRVFTNAVATAIDTGALSAAGNLWQVIDSDSDTEGVPANPVATGAPNALGAVADSAATGAVTSTDTLMAYAKQLVTMAGPAAADTDPLAVALYGAGITTMPAAAHPADAVSMIEVLRSTWARNIAGINPLGTVIFVAASGGSDANAGTSPNAAKATIAAAITAAGAGGTIVLGPGTHSVDVSAAALVPLANQQFRSAIPSYGGAPRAVIANDADDGANIVLVDVDGTVWKDIEFRNITAATTCVTQLGVSQTTAVRGIHFEGCWFNQNALDGAMISVAMNDATNATTGAVFKNCRFVGATGTTSVVVYIQVGIGGTPSLLIEDCIFECQSADNDARAVDFLDPGAAGKSYGLVIRNNNIIGPSDGGLDAVPLQFAAAMTENEIIGAITHNFFTACATPPIPIDLVNNSVAFNYGGDNASGGTLVDPGT